MTDITAEQITKLEHYELDKHIVKAMRPEATFYTAGVTGQVSMPTYCDEYGEHVMPNFSTNWNVLLPLIIANDISMENYSGKFDHCYYTNENHEKLYWNYNKDPQRALSECSLLALQYKRNKL